MLKRYNRPEPETLPLFDALAAEGWLIASFSPYREGIDPSVAARIEPFPHTDADLHPALQRPGRRWRCGISAWPGPRR